MRIFCFNRYVYPDHSATSQLLTDLAEHLSGAGYEVVLVGSSQCYDAADAALPAHEHVRGFEVMRVGGTRFGRNSLLGRSLDYMSYLLAAARLLRRHVVEGDVVVLMTDPPLLGTLLGPLARRRGARVVNWLQDMFPEIAEVLLGAPMRWAGPPLRSLRNRGLRMADRNVVISRAMATRVAAAGVANERIGLIENWTDEQGVLPVEPRHNPLRREWGMQDKFVIGYSGNLGRAHDWQTMLEVADTLRAREDIHFVLIGGGKGAHAFANAAGLRGLSNISVQSYQSRENLSNSLSVPDLHWFSLHPALEGCILPSKLYGIQAAGRPALFIGAMDGELARFLRDTGTGFAVAPGSASEVCASIERLIGDPALAATMGMRARQYLEANGTRSAALMRWQAVLASTSSQGNH
ncbi:glycosyltransferase family 4 protein [Thermomonas sp.]|uniref:glycosyltransferase family 4 protein n=1 Tax=Thermomonas sp. TaxID=1971895 RepID=UPI00248867B1|nr:glycosyltransferase family 4 protein [Thermomonas sp.]MDI1253492.1 glycosyltransferase family 4 protein [Thermomonas sp.]